MPQILIEENKILGDFILWNIKEEESFFIDNLDIRFEKLAEINDWHEGRRLEWLAGRFLIQKFLNCTSRNLIVDKYGKPHLPESNIHFSLSHSAGFIALFKSSRMCGIDIQSFKPSISRIAHKFCSDADLKLFMDFSQLETYHYLWSIKEAIYKAYGKREIDFKRDILTKELVKIGNGLKVDGFISKPNFSHRYHVKCRRIGSLYTAIAIEI